MKQIFRFFTLLLTAVVTSSPAWSAIDVPKPKPVALELGKEYYILNVGSGKYAGNAEAWGSQTCVVNSTHPDGLAYTLLNATLDGSATGLKDEDGNDIYELPEGQFYLYAKVNSKPLTRYESDNIAGQDVHCCFSDQGGFNNLRSVWQIKEVGTNVYTIQVPETDDSYVDGEVLGVQYNHYSKWAEENNDGVTNGLYYDVNYADAPEMCQFQFLPADAMNAYQAKLGLVELIERAQGLSLNTTEAEAVVANENATVEEVEAVKQQLTEALAEFASRTNPADITNKFIIPSVPLPNNYGTWTMRDAGGKDVAFDCNYDAGTINVGELWNRGGYSIDYTIKNLPAGVYNLYVEAWTRTDMVSVLQAGTVKKNVATVLKSKVDNRNAGRQSLNNSDELRNNLLFVQEVEGDVDISLTADNTTGDHWTCWGYWKLINYGNTDDDYKALLELGTPGWEKEFVTTDPVVPIKPFTQSYFDAVNTTIESGMKETTKENILAAYNKVGSNIEALRKNISLYEQLKKLIDRDVDPWSSDFGGYGDFVAVFDEVKGIFDAEDYTKTNEYMEELISRYEVERQNAIDNLATLDYNPGDDVSYYIKNRKFKTEDGTASSFDGWTVASSSWFVNNSGEYSVVEQWSDTDTQTGVIDVYQEIAPQKVGVYLLKSKGWYRSTNVPKRRNNPGYETVNTYLYGASSEYKFHDIYDHLYTPEERAIYFPNGSIFDPLWDGDVYRGSTEKDAETLRNAGWEFVLPQNVIAADELFNHEEVDWYDMECRFLGLGTDTPVKIGVRGRNIPPRAWLIWDDFELVYESDKLDDMVTVASEVALAAQEDLEGNMYQESRNALQECIDGLENPESTDQLIYCYRLIDDARETARNSRTLYQQLQDKLDELDNALFDYSKTATTEAYNAASTLSSEVDGGINEGSIADDDVPGIINDINEAIAKLKIPRTDGASDSNPVEFTAVITNPRYFNGDNISATWEGWTDSDGNFGSVSNAVQLVENAIGFAEGWTRSFDLYQDIYDLPEGTYEVRVWGMFNQNSFAKESLLSQYEYAEKIGKLDNLREEDKTDLIERMPRARFYANRDTASFHRWNFIATDEWTEAAKSDFNISISGNDLSYVDSLTVGASEEELLTYYFPQDRTGVYLRCQQGYYENKLYTYVGEDGHLRIGACNKAAEERDWVTFSNWRLYYLGTESMYEEGTGIREKEVAKTTVVDGIYTVDGRKIQTMQKGMNIVVVNGKAIKVVK